MLSAFNSSAKCSPGWIVSSAMFIPFLRRRRFWRLPAISGMPHSGWLWPWLPYLTKPLESLEIIRLFDPAFHSVFR